MKKGPFFILFFASTTSLRLCAMESKAVSEATTKGANSLPALETEAANLAARCRIIQNEVPSIAGNQPMTLSSIATRANGECVALGTVGVVLMRNDNKASQATGLTLIAASIAHYTGNLAPILHYFKTKFLNFSGLA